MRRTRYHAGRREMCGCAYSISPSVEGAVASLTRGVRNKVQCGAILKSDIKPPRFGIRYAYIFGGEFFYK